MKARAFPQLYILILLATFGAFAAVFFSPGQETIATHFGVSTRSEQLTLMSYLFGYAFSPLPYGPLSNAYGRRRAIYIGYTIASASALLSIVFVHFGLFELFIASRFFLGFGGGVGLMMTFTMIGDVYKGAAATKVIAYTMLAFAIMPGASIAVASFLLDEFGWLSLHYFLFLYTLAVFYFSSRLPETASTRDDNALCIKSCVHSYLHQGKEKEVVLGGIIIGLATSFIYIFTAKAPFIALSVIGMSVSEYGIFNFMPPIGLAIGSISASRLADYFKPIRAILIGMIIAATGILTMLLAFSFGMMTSWKLFLPIPLIYVGLSLIFTNIPSLIINDAKDKASASSVMTFINLFINALTVLSTFFVKLNNPIFLPLIFSAILVALLLLYQPLKKFSQ